MIGKRRTKCAVESKVTTKNHVSLVEKGIQGLQLAETDGYVPVLAALYIQDAGELWYMASAKGTQSGAYDANWFRTRPFEPLQSDTRKEFLKVLYYMWPRVRDNPRPIPILQQYLGIGKRIR